MPWFGVTYAQKFADDVQGLATDTEMALEHVPRCQHVKVNGVQCGSPVLRNRARFFHTRAEYDRQLVCDDRSGKRTFGFPLLEDANAIQVALIKVVQMLGAGTLDHKTASLMLYALQTRRRG